MYRDLTRQITTYMYVKWEFYISSDNLCPLNVTIWWQTSEVAREMYISKNYKRKLELPEATSTSGDL